MSLRIAQHTIEINQNSMSLVWSLLILSTLTTGVQSAVKEYPTAEEPPTLKETRFDQLLAKILVSRGIEEIEPPGGFDHKGSVKAEESELDERSIQNYHLKICYFCDIACKNKIGSDYLEFYEDVTNRISAMLNTIDPSLYAFSVSNSILDANNVAFRYISWFKTRNLRRAELLDHISNNFWKAKVWDDGNGVGTSLWSIATTGGRLGTNCDVGILTVPSGDSLWSRRYVGSSVKGIASMTALCSSQSFGTVRLYDRSPGQMASLVAHELGHIMGMYHDGPTTGTTYNERYCEQLVRYFDASLEEPCRQVLDTCPQHGCLDGRGRCVMNSVVSSRNTKFSSCSAAYWSVYLKLEQFAPNLGFDLSCIKQGSKKRTVGEDIHIPFDINNVTPNGEE